MGNITNNDLLLSELNASEQNANDSHSYQHLYLRGNFQMDMFYDKVDLINAWNRIWLSARATEVQILSVVILNNHFHINAIFDSNEQRANFKHHLRLSLTQYHNRRHNVQGTLGTRTLKQGILKDTDDLKDCICYHIRNTLHHNVYPDYLNYPFHTGRYVFNMATKKQYGIYTRQTMPEKLGSYLPAREELPIGWLMTAEGMIVPPHGIFRSDIVEALFNSREEYLEQLSHPTTRETTDTDEPETGTHASDSRGCQSLCSCASDSRGCQSLCSCASDSRGCQSLCSCASDSRGCQSRGRRQDEQIVEFVKDNYQIDIPAMNDSQKMEAIFKIIKTFPDISHKLLVRLFGIPSSTLRFRLSHWHPRE